MPRSVPLDRTRSPIRVWRHSLNQSGLNKSSLTWVWRHNRAMKCTSGPVQKTTSGTWSEGPVRYEPMVTWVLFSGDICSFCQRQRLVYNTIPTSYITTPCVYYIIIYPTISYITIPYHTLSYHNYQTILYDIILYYIPFNTITYFMIPLYTL